MKIKKELLVYGLAILLVVSLFGTLTGTGAWVEENDVGDTYLSSGSIASNHIEIYDWYGLNEVRNNLDADYILMNDLDEDTDGYDELVDTEEGWEPIGHDYHWGEEVEFRGTFDGNGFEIRNLYVNRPDEYRIGLFGVTYDGAEITNLGVVDAYVRGDYSVGGLVGYNRGTVGNSYSTGDVIGEDTEIGGLVGENDGKIENSYATNEVSGSLCVGGLVGLNYGTISNSYAMGYIWGDCCVGGLVGTNYYGTVIISYATGDVSGDELVGGLMGENTGTVSDSYATGQVNGDKNAGGLVGHNDEGTVSNSYATGDVSGDRFVGGLVGYNFGYDGTVENSYSTGDVIGEGWYVGGLVGSNDGMISDSYAIGKVSGVDWYVGGLVGNNDGTIENSYATGQVNGDKNAGGLVGKNDGTVSDSYAIGKVSGDDWYTGGLLGINYGTVENSFWDIYTTGQDHSEGGIGKYTEEMIKEGTFTDAGWDFEDTWDIIEKETYPFLQWQEEDTYPYAPELVEYELTINIDGEGTVEVDGAEVEDGWLQKYVEGTEITLEAIPEDGWKFVGWTGDATGTDTTTITMDDDKTITANFEEIVEYTLTIEIEGRGSTDPEAGTHTYEEGTVVIIGATPDDGWEFVEWTGDYEGDLVEIEITMDGDKTITANFKQEETPGFTLALLIVGIVLAVAIYNKKSKL